MTEREALELVALLRRRGWAAHGSYELHDESGQFRWTVTATKRQAPNIVRPEDAAKYPHTWVEAHPK
jgi:hypothetical protein